jgi:hypothetical protein
MAIKIHDMTYPGKLPANQEKKQALSLTDLYTETVKAMHANKPIKRVKLSYMVQDEDIGKIVAFKKGPFWKPRWIPILILEKYVHLTGAYLLKGWPAPLAKDIKPRTFKPMTEEAIKANPDYMEYLRDTKN